MRLALTGNKVDQHCLDAAAIPPLCRSEGLIVSVRRDGIDRPTESTDLPFRPNPRCVRMSHLRLPRTEPYII